MEDERLIKEIFENLEGWVETARKSQVIFGFDGFLDSLFSVVAQRQSLKKFDVFERMEDWITRLSSAVGSSANMEVILKSTRTGGFVANTCRGLCSILENGQNVKMIGMFGHPRVHSAFSDLFGDHFLCNLRSIGNPGKTNAYEFGDGKIMLTHFEPIHQLTYKLITAEMTEKELIEDFQAAKLIGMGYWSINPHMADIFTGFLEKILPKAFSSVKNEKTPDLFIDSGDIRKKPKEDILHFITLLAKFNEYTNVTLSVNDKEAEAMADALGVRDGQHRNEDFFLSIGKKIFARLSIKRFIIHTPRTAYSWETRPKTKGDKEVIEKHVTQAFTSQAAFTTSAGDMFNSGVCFGLLNGRTATQLLLLGNATTAFFVRTGKAPNQRELKRFLETYKKYLEQDSPNIL